MFGGVATHDAAPQSRSVDAAMYLRLKICNGARVQSMSDLETAVNSYLTIHNCSRASPCKNYIFQMTFHQCRETNYNIPGGKKCICNLKYVKDLNENICNKPSASPIRLLLC